MAHLIRFNALSDPVSPALRTVAPNSYGRIAPFENLGTTWRIKAKVKSFRDQGGYLLGFNGINSNGNPANMGIVQGVGGVAANNFGFYFFQALTPNPSVGGTYTRVAQLGPGNTNRENTFDINATPSGVTAAINGGSPVALPIGAVGGMEITANFTNGSLILGGYTDAAEFLLKEILDNLQVYKDDVLLVDIDFEDGTGSNKSSPGTFDLQVVNGAIIYPQPTTGAPGTLGTSPLPMTLA